MDGRVTIETDKGAFLCNLKGRGSDDLGHKAECCAWALEREGFNVLEWTIKFNERHEDMRHIRVDSKGKAHGHFKMIGES